MKDTLTLRSVRADFLRTTKGLYSRRFTYAAFMEWFVVYRRGLRNTFHIPSSRAAHAFILARIK